MKMSQVIASSHCLNTDVEGDSPSTDGSQRQSDQELVLTLSGSLPADAKEATPRDSAEADGAVSPSER